MNDRKNKRSTKKRLAVAFLIVGLFLIVCLIRSVILVAVNQDEYHRKALAQATGSSKTILSKPGVILDSNGIALAENIKVYRIILDPKVMNTVEHSTNPGSLEATAGVLSEAFSLSKEEVIEAFTADTSRSYLRFQNGTVYYDEDIERYHALVNAFEEEKKAANEKASADRTGTYEKVTSKIAGVWFEEEYRRTYPLQDVLSKVVGYTTRDASQGILGLELQYNSILRGTDGKEYTYIDENGNVTKEVTDEIDGETLITSLDSNVARIVREEIRKYQEEIGGKRINVLVMNPKNGEIIDMESDTEFNLNDPQDLSALFSEEELENPAELYLIKEAFRGKTAELEKMSREEQLEALLQLVQQNYAVSGTYEPGSTAKAMTLAAGIESGVLDPDETFYCDGAIGVGKYSIHCHMDTLCGNLRPIEAFGRSCNVCFVRMSARIGRNLFSKFQELFNLGQKTNIDLPGEANTSGLIYYESGLNEIELATNSFGQGFNVSMVQLASVYSSLINGGYYYEPHVVKEIVDGNGNTVKEIEPVLVRRTVSESTSEYMREALNYVVTRGTAGGILGRPGYDFGGKTGAAEKLPRGTGKYVVSFIGAAPLNDPKLLVYVVIDEPFTEDQSMSWPAQQLAAGIFDRLFSYYNIYGSTQDDAYSYDWSKLGDYSGMSDAKGDVSFIDGEERDLERLFDDGEDDRN